MTRLLSFRAAAGDQSAYIMVAVMRALIDGGQADERLKRLAVGLRADGSHRDDLLRRVFDVARDWFQTEHDPSGFDTAQTVSAMFDTRQGGELIRGDCVHRATFIAALIKALGIPNVRPALRLIASNQLGLFSHVYAGAKVGSESYLWLDPQERAEPFDAPTGQRMLTIDV